MTTRNRELASIIDASGNITTGGNLSVAGNLTQTNSTTTSYSDGLLELNSGAGSNSNDLGLVMERGSTGDNAIFLWDESNDGFAVGTTTAVGTATGNISFSAAPFTASTITGTILTGSTSVKTPLIEYTDGDDAITIADGGHITTGANLSIGGSNNELRFYEGSNYVGFEAPALSADQIWVLPTADGSANQILKTDGSGTLSWTDDLTLANASVNNFSGNGSTTGFTLSSTPVSENATQVYINGVYQFKNTYAVSGTTLTFDAAPPNGSSIEALVWSTVAVNIPADSSITSAKLAGDLTLPGHLTLAASKEIRNASGDLTIDVAGDLILDADGGDIQLKDGGSTFGLLSNDNFTLKIQNHAQDTDISFIGNDGGSLITALTLDMSDAGSASFNHDVKLGDSSELVLGDSSDIRMFHDGTNSFILCTVTGALSLKANDINIMDAQSHNMITAAQDGAVVLYHDNSSRLATDAEGANVTGTLDVSSKVVVAGGTEATSSDGSIRTAGGISAVKKIYSGSDITLAGSLIHASDLTLDVGGDIILDADGGDIRFSDGGTQFGIIFKSSNDLALFSNIQDGDLLFRGNDGGTNFTALTLDMSAAGAATFNDKVIATELDISGDIDVDGTANLDNTDIDGTLNTSGVVTCQTSAKVSQVAITSSSNAVAWDAAAAQNAYHVTTENTTFSAPSNAVEGAVIQVEIAQGGTARTIAWNTVFEFAASTAPTVTATANKTDIFTFRYNGSVWQEIGRVQNMAQT